jgi:formyl-CoA transferase/CoA:oxalate CoA-transferase
VDPSLLEAPEFRTNVERVNHRDLLESRINRLLEGRTTSEVYRILSGAGIPCAPVNNIGDAVNNDQIKFREMIMNMDSDYGKVTLPGSPLRLSSTPGTVRMAPPWLGNSNEEILTEAGYSITDIQELYSRNIIFKRKSDMKD